MVSSRSRGRRETDLLIDHLMALSHAELRGLRRRYRLQSSQHKKELREIFSNAIREGTLSTDAIVEFLDEVTPWGKQHVFLYRGPKGTAKKWRDRALVKTTLQEHNLLKLLDKKIPLVLPHDLTLASIQSSPSILRVTAIRRREGWVRDYDLIKSGKTSDGREIEYRGFVRQVLRGLVAFEWNLVANDAMLQISQLPTGGSYEVVAAEFSKCVAPWLDLEEFSLVDVRRSIGKLRKLEREGKSKATSHGLSLDRLGSRRVTLRSTSNKVPLLGDTPLDKFIETIESDSVPRINDLYWNWNGATQQGNRAHSKPTHTVIVGERKRINFMTPSSEEGLRNVLAELRRLSK